MSKSRNMARSAKWTVDYKSAMRERDFLAAAQAIKTHTADLEKRDSVSTPNHMRKIFNLISSLAGAIEGKICTDEKKLGFRLPTKPALINATRTCRDSFQQITGLLYQKYPDLSDALLGVHIEKTKKKLQRTAKAIHYPQ